MGPDRTSSALLRIAASIDSSEAPRAAAVLEDLRAVVARVAQEGGPGGLEECAAMCEECAAMCDSHADRSPIIRACAEVCRACAAECRRLAAEGGAPDLPGVEGEPEPETEPEPEPEG